VDRSAARVSRWECTRSSRIFNYHVTLRIFGHLIHLIVLETVPLVTLGLTSFCSEKNCSNSSAFAAGGGRFLGKVFA